MQVVFHKIPIGNCWWWRRRRSTSRRHRWHRPTHDQSCVAQRPICGLASVTDDIVERRYCRNFRWPFRQFVSLWVMKGATHHSRQGTSDKSYDALSGHWFWCLSVVLVLELPKLVGDLFMNTYIQHDHASTSPPTSA